VEKKLTIVRTSHYLSVLVEPKGRMLASTARRHA
jgi:hypothetical protein